MSENEQNQIEVTAEDQESTVQAEETNVTVDGGEAEGESQPSETAEAVVSYSEEELQPLIESLLFAYGEPLSSQRLAEIARVDEGVVDGILLTLVERSKSPEYGVELVRIAEKYQYRSKSRFASAIRELKAGKPKRLSGAALETLAIIAYRQPVVKSDVEKIRGVDVSPTLKTLIERGFVKIVGHQSTVGQPALYGTTDEFLKIFGLNSLAELPSLREIAEFEMEPGEMEDDTPASGEQIAVQ